MRTRKTLCTVEDVFVFVKKGEREDKNDRDIMSFEERARAYTCICVYALLGERKKKKRKKNIAFRIHRVRVHN